MIQANQWYNIAATQITPSKTGMNITLGAFSIRCNISVDWGNATITIVDALTSSAKISLRIRSLGGDFFADVKASSALDGEIVSVLYDNNYWSAPPVTVASGGDTVCIINDVSEYIPGGGSGGDSQDINQLKVAINTNAANISTLSKEMERVKDWFELKTLSDGTKVLVTKYNLATEKNLAWGGSGGVESNPGSGSSYNRLDSWETYDEAAGDVLSAKLGYGLKTSIENIEQTLGSGLLSKVTIKLGLKSYESIDGVVSLPAYPIVPSLLSSFTDDVGYAKSSDVQQIFQTYSENLEALENRVEVNEDNILSLDGRIESVEDWFTLQTVAGVKTLVTKYPLATQKNLIWGGSSGDSAVSSVSYNRLDSWDGYTDAMAGYVLSAGLGYSLKQTIDNISSQQLTKVTVKVGSVAYDSVGGVVSLPAYPTIPAKLSSFTDDVGYAKQSDVEAISLRLDNFLFASDTDTIINKWHELEAFLAGQSESSTLAELLGIKADKSVVEALSNRVTVSEGNIISLQNRMESVEDRVSGVEDWFQMKVLSDGSRQLVTKYHLATEKGLVWGGSSGSGSPSSSASYNRLDSWDGYTDAMAGYVLSAGLGYSLKQAIENISSNNSPSEVTVKVGSVAYDSVDGVVSLPAYPTIPAKLSAFTDDVVSGNYLPLAGGVLSGSLSVPNINITSAAAVAHLAFGRQGGNFITAPTGGYLAFVAEGKGIATASADLVVTDSIVYPGTDGVTQLGFGGKRWSKVSSIDGEFAGALTAGTFSTANVVSCGGRLRVNASNSVTSFGFLKSTAYTTALNRAVLDIGSNYGGSSDIASETVDVVAMSMYRGAVGVGRAFTYDELYANRASNVMLSVEGNAQATGSITAAFFNGNATSATKLATARSIYGQAFDGTQDITSAKVINFTDAEPYAVNESGAARVGRFDTNGGLKIQLGNSDDAVIEIVNKGATIALLRMDASGNLRVKGNLIVEGNLTWGGAL